MMGDFLEHLAVDQQIGVHEHIQRVIHDSLGGVFDRDNPKIGQPSLHFVEHVFDAVHGDILGGRPKFLRTGEVGKCGARTKVGHLLRTLERERG